MKKAKILLLVSLIIICLTACVSCNKETSPDTADDANGQKTLCLFSDGKTEFTLIRARGEESHLDTADFSRVNHALNDCLNEKIAVFSDGTQEASADSYEILVGNTNREEGQIIAQTLRVDEYFVGISGNKFIIVGGSAKATSAAVDCFLENFISGKTLGDTLSVSDTDNVSFAKEYRVQTMTLGGHSMTKYSIVIPQEYTVTEYRTALDLSTHLSRNTGCCAEVLTDNESSSEYEILIGNTKRTKISADKNGYKIELDGTRLAIVADNVYAYDIALEKLTREIFKTNQKEIAIDTVSVSGTDTIDRAARLGKYRILINNIYGGHQPEHPFALRGEMLGELYAAYDPDILGFQEFTAKADGIVHHLDGYTKVAVANNSSRIFVSLFYKADKFDVLDSGFHKYTDGENDDSKSVCWAVFKDKQSGDVFAVASTHFSWKAEAGEARKTDARQLVEIIAKIEAEHNCPILFGGDFNCNPSSEPYGIITSSGAVDVQGVAEQTTVSNTAHTVGTFNQELGIYNLPIAPDKNYGNSIDHIFLDGKTDNISLKKFLICTDEYALLSTDHTPLILDFNIG